LSYAAKLQVNDSITCDEGHEQSPAKCFILSFLNKSEHENAGLENTSNYLTDTAHNPIVLGHLKSASNVELMAPEDFRELCRHDSPLPSVIMDFYRVRETFMAWKTQVDLQKNKPSLNLVLATINPQNQKLASIDIRKKFWLAQKRTVGMIQKPDSDGVYWKCCEVNGLEGAKQIILPPGLVKFVVSYTHRLNGHCKFKNLLEILQRRFAASSLRSVCKQVCAECYSCALSSRLTAAKKPVEVFSKLPAAPFRKVSIDVFGPIENTTLNMNLKSSISSTVMPKYFLTIIDVYSHFRAVLPMINTTAACIRLTLLSCFQITGYPTVIVCDEAASFKALEGWATTVGIEMRFTQSYDPSSHGLVERVHKDLCSTLRSGVVDGGEFWVEGIFHRVLIQNLKQVQNSTFSPSSLTFKFTPQLPGQQFPIHDQQGGEVIDDYQTAWMAGRVKNRHAMATRQAAVSFPPVKKGDHVLVFKEPRTKLDQAWRQGTVKDLDQHGIILTDGTKHSFHHVKPDPSVQLNFGRQLKVGDLVVVNTDRDSYLAVVEDYEDPTLVQVRKVNIGEGYKVSLDKRCFIPRNELEDVQGNLEKRPLDKDENSLYLSRPLTKQLRRRFPELLPRELLVLLMNELDPNGDQCPQESPGDRTNISPFQVENLGGDVS
jgi:hypothetical protein